MTRQTVSRQILTFPNLLSALRIILIPAILWTYSGGHTHLSILLLVLSGATDVADGWLARRLHSVSDVGKILDPVADKLTLTSVLAMLLPVCPHMWTLLVILIVRELLMGCTGLLCIRATKRVNSARCHGKAATALVYAAVFIHLLWQEIPVRLSYMFIAICALAQLSSLALYVVDNLCSIRRARGGI